MHWKREEIEWIFLSDIYRTVIESLIQSEETMLDASLRCTRRHILSNKIDWQSLLLTPILRILPAKYWTWWRYKIQAISTKITLHKEPNFVQGLPQILPKLSQSHLAVWCSSHSLLPPFPSFNNSCSALCSEDIPCLHLILEPNSSQTSLAILYRKSSLKTFHLLKPMWMWN